MSIVRRRWIRTCGCPQDGSRTIDISTDGKQVFAWAALAAAGFVAGLTPQTHAQDQLWIRQFGSNAYELALPGAPTFYSSTRRIVNARLIEVPDSTVLLALWDEQASSGELTHHYAISLGGLQFRVVRHTSYEVLLRYKQFDPLEGVPHVDPLFSAEADNRVFIVQFVTQPLEVFRVAIRELGGTMHHYLGNHAHIVRMSPDVRQRVAALPYVRWIGPLHPAYRLEEFMLQNADRGAELFGLQKYNIMVFESGTAQKTAVAKRIEAMGGIVDRDDAGRNLLEATLTAEQLFELIRWDEVLFVDRWGPYEADMNIAREIGGANYIETVAGYTGAGVRGEVFDTGFNLEHVDFQSGPLIVHGSAPNSSHGAATSGIIFGDGTGNPMARGLLPEGQGIVASYFSVGLSGPGRYTHTGQLVQAPYFAVFQTSSVGSPRTTQYTTISADMDAMLFDFDIVHVQSQGNAGFIDSRPQGWAKNIITVSGNFHYNTLTKDDDCWCGGASIGPAADGRIKPDFTHFYDSILTVSGPGPTAYTTFGGSSGATPIVAGHVGLFFQMWSDGIFGNRVGPGATVFENRSHMTTAKALMINTAFQYDWINGPPANRDLTRYRQGWGLPDVKNMYELRRKFLIIDETVLLTNLQVARHRVTVLPAEPALKVTMTYADPPGVPNSTRHRINDLTLKVISPSQTVYWGNHGLLEGNWSTPGGSANTIDTVENVFVENPETGTWIVEVHADEINQDGHVETPEIDADYALVVSGVHRPGDLNCDGRFDGGDIDPFFLALGDPAAYAIAFPNCDIILGDMNRDGRLDGGDIDPFFQCLGGNCP